VRAGNDNNQKGRTIEIISDSIGIPAKTYQRALKIIEHGTPEVKKGLEAEFKNLQGISKNT
jgi:hypothetical protein